MARVPHFGDVSPPPPTEAGHGGYGNQSGDCGRTRPQHPGSRRASPRRANQFRNQPQAGNTQEFGKLYFAYPRPARISAQRWRDRTLSPGAEDPEPRWRRARQPGSCGDCPPLHASSPGAHPLDRAPGSAGPGGGCVYREGGGAGILQGQHLGRPPNVPALHQRRQMPDRLVAQAGSGELAAPSRPEKANAEDYHQLGEAGRGIRARSRAGSCCGRRGKQSWRALRGGADFWRKRRRYRRFGRQWNPDANGRSEFAPNSRGAQRDRTARRAANAAKRSAGARIISSLENARKQDRNSSAALFLQPQISPGLLAAAAHDQIVLHREYIGHAVSAYAGKILVPLAVDDAL